MRRGDFEASWAINDQVLAHRDQRHRDDPSTPYHLRWVWDGRPFDGSDVLVRCYHGLGDTLQFCRYLAPLRRRVRSLSVEIQPELIPLLATLPGPDRLTPFHPEAPAPPSPCDLEIMELAHALRMPPDPAPYLTAPSPPILPNALNVGLCWNPGGAWSPERAVPAALLAPLASLPGITLFSLQRGPAAAEFAAPIIADANMEILHTARLIRGLDLVVAVDTMVAHLAGALGTPVWLLLTADPDWRWSNGGRGSPWYRHVRKYQQSIPGDWAPPIAELTADLTQAAQDHSLAGTKRDCQGL